MIKYYITNNINRTEPEILKSIRYVHVKCKTDGSHTAIVTKNTIEDVGFEEKTMDEMQALLNDWINEENNNPDIDSSGQLVFQRFIDLTRIMELING